uniref:G-protein coupled receptors family 1 profile domain-containing protein n=1 Tax=Timema genevievae TaxID=629358 RepID=A0A7R9PRB0_TIMGE|nr:unnamed protein product [Timema genevievae]
MEDGVSSLASKPLRYNTVKTKTHPLVPLSDSLLFVHRYLAVRKPLRYLVVRKPLRYDTVQTKTHPLVPLSDSLPYVHRYLAVRKPLRYDTVQTKTRCQCWMVFTWISCGMLCCPPLLGFNKPLFDRDTYICMLDWTNMAAYSVTVGVLILGPSLITTVYTYTYIFSTMRKLRSGVPIHDKEYATALSENMSNPSHIMSFVLVVTFWLSWMPFAGLKLYEHFAGIKFQVPFLHFGVIWLGILNSFWKAVILVAMSPQFRLALRIFCLTAVLQVQRSLARGAHRHGR